MNFSFFLVFYFLIFGVFGQVKCGYKDKSNVNTPARCIHYVGLPKEQVINMHPNSQIYQDGSAILACNKKIASFETSKSLNRRQNLVVPVRKRREVSVEFESQTKPKPSSSNFRATSRRSTKQKFKY